MNLRTMLDRLRYLIIASLFVVCSSAGAAPRGTTEALPADGGDLGKAFAELKQAFGAADKVRGASLLDASAWHLDTKEPGWFARISEQLAKFSPVGGRRQGDRATLFVADKQPYYAMLNATYVAGAWKFDSPIPVGSRLDPAGRDCTVLPTRFPCAAKSAPDAQVAGTLQSYRVDPETKARFRPVAVLDGLAVRMVDPQAQELKSTLIVLSGTGINPAMVALSSEPDQVSGWLKSPVLVLEVAPDGKRAAVKYADGISPQSFEVTSGLRIDTQTPNRVRGELKTDQKDVAQFDITFDIGTLSDCLAGVYQCGD
ncbi:MAG: hypothetical protein BWK76_24410 [Desulfobulbaceae bacterium A2]|nr:MAG: hypothetical protein BWK76_24410 [Desulfobulbaceae bacterium A2]